MALSEEQLQQRRKCIGASDAAAICGVDPHRSATDVYMEKLLGVKPVTNPAIEAGDRLEPLLLEYASERLQRELLCNIQYTSADGINACNLDAEIIDTAGAPPKEIVEAKTTGLVEGWGDPDEDNAVPDKVLVQTHHQFHCTGAVVAWVPVILAKFGLKFELYRVVRNEELVQSVAQRCIDFWKHNVVPHKIPDDTPDLSFLRRIRREPGKIVDVDPEIVSLYVQATDTFKAAKRARDEAQAHLIAAMHDGDAVRSSAGCFTFFEYDRKEYTVAASKYRKLVARKELP